MKLQHSVSALTLALLISIGGCKKKDAEIAGGITESWIKDQVSLEVANRDITPDDAQAALEKMELWETGDKFTWEERAGENGYYTFKNIKIAESNTTIATAKVSGLRMLDDETAFADHFELTDITANDPDDDVTLNIKSVRFVLPDGEKFMEMVESLSGENLSDAEQMLGFQSMLKSGEIDLSLGEGYVDDLTLEGADFNMTMDFAGWAEDEDARKMSMLFKDISGQGEENGETFEFNLDNMSMKGLSLEYYDNMMASNFAKMNPFEPNVENLQIDNFSMNGGGLFVDMPKLHGWYTEKKGGKFQAITEMPSFIFGFDREPQDPELIKFKQGLNDMGYDQIEFSMTGETLFDETSDLIDVEMAQLSMTDGFDLNFDYKISGLKNMMVKMGESVDSVDYSDVNAMNAANLTMITEAIKNMNLHHFTMEFDDDSILERGFELAAKKQGVGADLIRQQAKGGVMMSTMAAQTDYQAELSKDFADNLVKLIDQGGAFRVEVRPEGGFDFAKTFEDYAAWQEGYMEALQSQMNDENVSSIATPEPFDMDGVLQAMGIDFQHEPN